MFVKPVPRQFLTPSSSRIVESLKFDATIGGQQRRHEIGQSLDGGKTEEGPAVREEATATMTPMSVTTV